MTIGIVPDAGTKDYKKARSAATDRAFFYGVKMTSAERTERIAEIQAEITEINNTLSYIRKAGQSYNMMTSAGGGTQRMTTNATYAELVKHRKELNAELKSLQGDKGFRLNPCW